MRLDLALTERGLARSRSHAAQLIRAGQVAVAGEPVRRPAHEVTGRTPITVDDDGYVSRAAYKLLGALDATGLTVGARVLDAGASTGGFTQVCLERGAQTVYAVDVGHDQLAPHLRDDPRVRVRERLNLRDLTPADLDDTPVDLVVADVSFISLTLLLAPMLGVLDPAGDALLMVKPQFEVGRERLTRTGVVRDPELHTAAVDGVLAGAAELGWHCHTRQRSVLPGQDGNVEFFVWLRRDSPMLAG